MKIEIEVDAGTRQEDFDHFVKLLDEGFCGGLLVNSYTIVLGK